MFNVSLCHLSGFDGTISTNIFPLFGSIFCEVAADIEPLHVSIHIFNPTLSRSGSRERPSNLEIQDPFLLLILSQALDMSKPSKSSTWT